MFIYNFFQTCFSRGPKISAKKLKTVVQQKYKFQIIRVCYYTLITLFCVVPELSVVFPTCCNYPPLEPRTEHINEDTYSFGNFEP